MSRIHGFGDIGGNGGGDDGSDDDHGHGHGHGNGGAPESGGASSGNGGGGKVIHVRDDRDYATRMRDLARTGGLVVVDFNATWCGPCRMMGPQLARLSELHPTVTFLGVDIDKCRGAASEAGVSSVPAFFLFAGGQKVGEMIGANPQGLANLVEKNKALVGGNRGASAANMGEGRRLGSAADEPVVVPDDDMGRAPAQHREADPVMLVELVGMGFDQDTATKALLAANNDMGAAVDWITTQQESAAPEPMEVPAQETKAPEQAAEAPKQAEPVVHNAMCNGCSKQIVGVRHKCKVCPDFDLCTSCLEAKTHDPTHEFTDYTEDTMPKLTPEEVKIQQQRLRERIAAKKKEREDEDRRRMETSEVDRRKSAKEMQETRERIVDMQRRKEDAQRKKDAEESRAAMAKVKAQIEQDKLERAARRKEQQGGAPQPQQPAPAPVPVSAPKEYTEANLQIRLPDGQSMRNTFAATATLREVHTWIARNRKDAGHGTGFSLLMPLPRRLFGPGDMSLTLKQADLVPSGVLIVTKP